MQCTMPKRDRDRAYIETTEEARRKAKILAALADQDRRKFISDLIEREFAIRFPAEQALVAPFGEPLERIAPEFAEAAK